MNEQVYYLVSNFSNSTVGLITHEICIYSQWLSWVNVSLININLLWTIIYSKPKSKYEL